MNCTCNPIAKQPGELTVRAAKDVGHMVVQAGMYDMASDRRRDEVMFAGTLAECLSYVSDKMAPIGAAA